ncbi:hypothetical protein Pint_24458 [Pistacia integerrima]|uniref:Uncharacterized protein n=1 Tax=Pistacia integerrima TaxID=434235 RepID=A0ACC0YC86_9ROSI|nr:hypothetical protein Pint_24458 [Pistacia integerrima]
MLAATTISIVVAVLLLHLPTSANDNFKLSKIGSHFNNYNRLAEVGREGFALLEELEIIPPSKKFGSRHAPQAHDFHRYPQHQYEPMIDSNQAAQLYGGKVVLDHRLRKQIPNSGYFLQK